MRKTLSILSVLSIVLGAFGTLSTGAGMLFNGALKQWGDGLGHPDAAAQALQREIQASMERYEPVLRGFSVVYLLFAIALVVLGVGMRRRAPWARSATLAWAALALVYTAVQTIFTVGFLMPALMAPLQNRLATLPPQVQGMVEHMMSAGTGLGGVMGTMFQAAFPIILIVLLTRAEVRREFTAA
jgi:hypothetical protein